MGVQVYWDVNQDSVMRYDFDSKWEWSEIQQQLDYALQSLALVPERTDIIIDLRNLKVTPTSVITHMRSLADHQPSNLRLVIYVSANPFITSLLQLVRNVNDRAAGYFKAALTIEEAYHIIQTDRLLTS